MNLSLESKRSMAKDSEYITAIVIVRAIDISTATSPELKSSGSWTQQLWFELRMADFSSAFRNATADLPVLGRGVGF